MYKKVHVYSIKLIPSAKYANISRFDVYLKKQKLDLQVAGLYVCRCPSQDVEHCSCD